LCLVAVCTVSCCVLFLLFFLAFVLAHLWSYQCLSAFECGFSKAFYFLFFLHNAPARLEQARANETTFLSKIKDMDTDKLLLNAELVVIAGHETSAATAAWILHGCVVELFACAAGWLPVESLVLHSWPCACVVAGHSVSNHGSGF
jgi:hypothetical protein